MRGRRQRLRDRAEPWYAPWLDFRRRFTARGRAELAIKRGLIETVHAERARRDLAVIAEAVRADRDDIYRRFETWDAAESARIRADLVRDLEPFFPGVAPERVYAEAHDFARLARDLPTKATDEAVLAAEERR